MPVTCPEPPPMLITDGPSRAVVERPTGQESSWRSGVGWAKAVVRQSVVEITPISRFDPHLGPTLAERL